MVCIRWGERSCSEYLLLKRSFGTYTRSKPASEDLRSRVRPDAQLIPAAQAATERSPLFTGERFLFVYGHDGRLTFIFLGGKRKKRGQKKNTKVFKNLHISKKSSTFAVAFGNRCALVHTAPLNERATDASALPTGCTTLAPVGDPINNKL